LDYEEDTYTEVFSALKHPARRMILRMLGEAPATYTEILNALGVETGLLNFHLESLRGLVAKGEDGRYRLSGFGSSALGLMRGVEEPVRRSRDGFSLFGRRVGWARVLAVVVAVLIASNAWSAYAYRELNDEGLNALGAVLMQTRGLVDESAGMLSSGIDGGVLYSVEALERDCVGLSRQLGVLIYLDGGNSAGWSEVKSGADDLMEFVSDLGGRLDAVTFSGDWMGYLPLTVWQSLYLGKVRDDLLGLGQAFPEKVVLGSSPSVEVPVEGISGAAEASARLRSDIQTARRAFSLGERFKIEFSGGEIQFQSGERFKLEFSGDEIQIQR
jgi:DNA-binding transcriptional ArsR family regulator